VSAIDQAGRTPLHHAALNDDRAEVVALRAAGADPDAQDAEGFRPLHLASQEGAVGAPRALLERGAAVDPKTCSETRLSSSRSSTHAEKGDLIGILRSHGADPDHVNRSGQTPLGLTRRIGNFDVARFFADLPEDRS